MEPVVIEGVVGHGRKLGRKLGFPTANLDVSQEIEVPDGVYQTEVELDGVTYRAMSNLGHNPSVGGVNRRLETYIFGFDGDLYDRLLRVKLLRWIREERTFSTVEELRAQIEKDKAYIQTL